MVMSGGASTEHVRGSPEVAEVQELIERIERMRRHLWLKRDNLMALLTKSASEASLQRSALDLLPPRVDCSDSRWVSRARPFWSR